MNKWFILGVIFMILFSSCSEFQTFLKGASKTAASNYKSNSLTNGQISSGLKEALQMGVANGLSQLGTPEGFFKNQMTRILLPKELQKVDKMLRDIGLGTLADEGLRIINRAAEDAVSSAKPIFISAIKGMTISDATGILMGGKTAATKYLERSTTNKLVETFKPNITKSLDRVGANKVWSNIISKYNLFARNKINPDLTDYVTKEAVKGVFKMVAKKETDIRENFASRTTSLLKKVFALQD